MSGTAPPPTPFTTSEWLEQYKAYLTDLGNVGSRYTTANGFYLSVISALMGVLALTESGKLLNAVPRSVLWAVCLLGSVICWAWYRTLSFYRRLFAAKFQVLNKLEGKLPLQCFAEEYAHMKGKGATSVLGIDKIVPIVVAALFIALAIVRSCK